MIKKAICSIICILGVIAYALLFVFGWYLQDSWYVILILGLMFILLLIVYSCARVASRISRIEEKEEMTK